jgi:hypothetical protein
MARLPSAVMKQHRQLGVKAVDLRARATPRKLAGSVDDFAR